MSGSAARAIFWRRVLRLTWGLLGAWLAVTLVGPWFARDLAGYSIAGYPLSFWIASQGALLLFLVIVVVYVVAMERLERELLDRDDG